VSAANPYYSSLNGILFDKSQTTLIEYPYAGAVCYIVPNNVVAIAGNAFYYCVNLCNVTLPNNLTNIGIGAFAYCSELTSISIPAGVTSINDGTFFNCTGLITAHLASSITNVGVFAFGSCDDLVGIYFDGNAPEADPTAFFDEWFYTDIPATIYYLPGTSGWSNSLAGVPTKFWLPRMQMNNIGLIMSTFPVFSLDWASSQTVIVDACTNLLNPVWLPLQTNTLLNGTSYFADPQWTNYPSRFYRLRSPR
jgi:hypothetical protein